jgi:hypothetical protein
VNSVAAEKSARPLYAEFLARVIQIEAVQCYRAAVRDDHTAQFFAAGRLPGVFGDFQWSVDAPEAFPWGPLAPATDQNPVPVSLFMEHAWDAAVTAWRAFITLIINGELIASGAHPGTGARSEIGRAEWARAGLVLDVRNGDLLEVRHGKHAVRWESITLRAAGPAVGSEPAGAAEPPPVQAAKPVQAVEPPRRSPQDGRLEESIGTIGGSTRLLVEKQARSRTRKTT